MLNLSFCENRAYEILFRKDDPLNNECAQHYKDNEKDAMRVSKEWTQKFAV